VPVSAADSLQNFGFLIRDVSRLSAKNFGRHARELEVTVSQCKVLAYLQRHEGISQTRLAELTETDPMTLVRTLDRMQQDGWIERRADPDDRRAHCLYLLDAARPILQRIWKIADQSRAEALGALSVSEREQLVALLQRVHARLSALDAR
jgi:DNA-binding MarR family transcriptional regulator